MKKYSKPIVLTLAILLAFALVAALAFASQISAKKIIVDYVDAASNTFNPGDTIQYEMTVSNPAENTETNTLTRIWDTLPNGTIIEFLGPGETLEQGPGDSDTFYASYVVDWADVQYNDTLERYFVRNKFHAEGYDTLDNAVEATVNWNSTIVMPPLEVSKTAAGTYDRTVTWELDKTVNGEKLAEFSGMAGDTFGPVDWKVVATKYEEIGNYKITGTITIHNPAAVEQDYSVADVLDDNTTVEFLDPALASGTIAERTTLDIEYRAFPDDDSATLNTATVTAPYNPPQEATAEVGFTENLIGDDEVTLADVRSGYVATPISSSTTWDYKESFTCSADAEMYTDGKYSAEFLNTATLTGPNTDLASSAEVTIECELPALQVSKTAAGSYDRTVEWTLDKTVNGKDLEAFSGMAGDTFGPVVWEVVATKSVVEDNHKVAGTITIHNPAAVEQSYSSVTDVLDDGTTVVFLDPASGTIAAGATSEIRYEAFPDDDSATLNTATVTAAGNAPVVATADVEFAVNASGDNVVTLADDDSPFPDALISSSTTWTYEESFTCSADAEMYTDGKYSAEFPNTATLTGPNTGLADSAMVTIECVLPEGEETAWARMYDQPYNFTHKFDGHPWFSYLITKPDAQMKTFYFYAGQYHRVGEVDIWKEGNMLRIEIRMDQGYTLVDSKVNVQRGLNQFHRTPWAPGSYPYTGGVSFTIPYRNNWNGQDLTIAIHGNVRGYFD